MSACWKTILVLFVASALGVATTLLLGVEQPGPIAWQGSVALRLAMGINVGAAILAVWWFMLRPVPPPPRPLARAALAGRRILLAEDNEVNQLVAAEVLARSGFQCDVVANGREAIGALSEKDYDLVLMDCQMPEMDGLEAARTIRRREAQRRGSTGTKARLPIVALTAHAIEEDREECLAAGMDAFLAKPIDPSRLVETINRLLRETQPPPADSSRQRPDGAPEVAETSPAARASGHGPAGRAEQADPFGRQELLERCLGDVNFCREILKTFAERAAGQVAELEQAAAAHDTASLIQRAHALKGVAANLAAEPLRQRALELEQLGRAGDSARIAATIEQVRREVDRCLEAIPRLVEELAAC